MKHKGSVCDYKNERNKDLFRAYRQLLETERVINPKTFFKKLVRMPSKRFWVSEERASVVLSVMLQEKQPQAIIRNRKEMFREIYKRAIRLMKKEPELSISEVARRVVNQQAPKFYLSPKSAKYIIFYEKKKWYEQRKKQLKHLFL